MKKYIENELVSVYHYWTFELKIFQSIQVFSFYLSFDQWISWLLVTL
jgi:hypothetical protein